jgi:hypothetical protein
VYLFIVTKFPAFYGTRRFIVVFTTVVSQVHSVCNLTQCFLMTRLNRPIFSIDDYTSQIITPLHIFQLKFCVHLSSPYLSRAYPASFKVLNLITGEYKFLKFLIMQCLLASCYFVLLRSRYSPCNLFSNASHSNIQTYLIFSAFTLIRLSY